jgi:hypothetical protein
MSWLIPWISTQLHSNRLKHQAPRIHFPSPKIHGQPIKGTLKATLKGDELPSIRLRSKRGQSVVSSRKIHLKKPQSVLEVFKLSEAENVPLNTKLYLHDVSLDHRFHNRCSVSSCSPKIQYCPAALNESLHLILQRLDLEASPKMVVASVAHVSNKGPGQQQ